MNKILFGVGWRSRKPLKKGRFLANPETAKQHVQKKKVKHFMIYSIFQVITVSVTICSQKFP